MEEKTDTKPVELVKQASAEFKEAPLRSAYYGVAVLAAVGGAVWALGGWAIKMAGMSGAIHTFMGVYCVVVVVCSLKIILNRTRESSAFAIGVVYSVVAGPMCALLLLPQLIKWLANAPVSDVQSFHASMNWWTWPQVIVSMLAISALCNQLQTTAKRADKGYENTLRLMEEYTQVVDAVSQLTQVVCLIQSSREKSDLSATSSKSDATLPGCQQNG